MAVTPYGVPMSRALRCLWTLEEVGVPYENVKVDFRGEAQKPEFSVLSFGPTLGKLALTPALARARGRR